MLELTQDEIENRRTDGAFKNIPIRFFIECQLLDDEDGHTLDITECSEQEFLNAEGVITYERHSVFQNGADQVCLTKMQEY